MKTLKDLKVGDPIIVTEVNYRKNTPHQFVVTKVGRKYLEVGRDGFEMESGNWRSKDYPHHKHAYTLEEWDRYQLEMRYRESARKYVEALRYSYSLNKMTNDELTLGISQFESLCELIAAKR